MSGSQLALDILAEGAARKSPKFARQLTRIALRLLQSPIHASGRALADVCTPDTLEVYLNVLAPAIRGSSSVKPEEWACYTRLADRGQISISDWRNVVANQPHLLKDQSCFEAAVAAASSHPELQKELADSALTLSVNSLIGSLLPPRSAHTSGSFLEKFGHQVIRRLANLIGLDRTFSVSVAGIGNVLPQLVTCQPDSSFACNEDLPVGHHPSWDTVVAALQYAAEGTASALADMLEVVARSSVSDLSPHVGLPWPGAACLSFVKGGASAEVIAGELRNGTMGDLEVWRSWEEAWRSSEIDSWAEGVSGYPFTRDRWQAAPLLGVTRYRQVEHSSSAEWATLSRCADIATQFTSPSVSTSIMALGLITFVGRWPQVENAPEASPSPTRVIDLLHRCKAADSSTFAPVVVRVLFALWPSIQQWNEKEIVELGRLTSEATADAAALVSRMKPFLRREVLIALRVAIAREPDLNGLLIFVGLEAASAGAFRPFDVDTHKRRTTATLTPAEEWSLLVIGARQEGLEPGRFDHVASIARQIESERLTELFSALGASVSRADTEAVLVGLYERLKSSGSDEHLNVLLDEMSGSVAQRTTELWSEREWERLGFPQGMLSICRDTD